MNFSNAIVEYFLSLQVEENHRWETAVLATYLCLNWLLKSAVIPILPNNEKWRKLQTDWHYVQIVSVISSMCPQALFLRLTNANLYLLPVCQVGKKKKGKDGWKLF